MMQEKEDANSRPPENSGELKRRKRSRWGEVCENWIYTKIYYIYFLYDIPFIIFLYIFRRGGVRNRRKALAQAALAAENENNNSSDCEKSNFVKNIESHKTDPF